MLRMVKHVVIDLAFADATMRWMIDSLRVDGGPQGLRRTRQDKLDHTLLFALIVAPQGAGARDNPKEEHRPLSDGSHVRPEWHARLLLQLDDLTTLSCDGDGSSARGLLVPRRSGWSNSRRSIVGLVAPHGKQRAHQAPGQGHDLLAASPRDALGPLAEMGGAWIRRPPHAPRGLHE
jgi:hypothetical protein